MRAMLVVFLDAATFMSPLAKPNKTAWINLVLGGLIAASVAWKSPGDNILRSLVLSVIPFTFGVCAFFYLIVKEKSAREVVRPVSATEKDADE